MAKKRYKLHCFRCRALINGKEDLFRNDRKEPICGQCNADSYNSDVDAWEEEEWYRNHPGVNKEQYDIDQANIRKYGEC